MRREFCHNRLWALVCLGLVGLNSNVCARGDSVVVWDSLPYNAGEGGTVAGPDSMFGLWASGFSFVPASTVYFDSAALEIGGYVNSQGMIGTNAFTLRLAAGDMPSGGPGTILESFTVVGQLQAFGYSHPGITNQSITHPILQAGHKYWLVAFGIGDMEGAWNMSSLGLTGQYYSIQGGREVLLSGQAMGAFQITGVTEIPEPIALSLFGAFFAAFCLTRRARLLR